MRKRTVGLVVGLVLCVPVLAESAMAPHFDEGVKLLKQLEYARAIKAFEKALDWPGNTAAERATIHLQVGVAHSNLNDYDAAEASFKKALTEDRTIKLPAHTSPKIQAVFEKVQAELPAAKPVVTPTPTPPVKPEPPPLPPPVTPRSRVNWPAWITLGAAVATGGAGLAMGLLNRSEKSKAQDTSVPYNEALSHADNASSHALAANILFGVAGAAAVTSGVLFYLGYRKEQARVSAALVPTSSGVMVQLELRR